MKVGKKWGGYFLCCIIIFCACAPNQQDKNTVTIWHWMNDRQAAFEKLSQQYADQTGINVEFKLFFPPDIYSQKVIAAARAGNLPDVFGILGEKQTLGSFIKAGHIANLTAYNPSGRYWEDSFRSRPSFSCL